MKRRVGSTGALVASSLVNRHKPSFGSRGSGGDTTLVGEGMLGGFEMVDMVEAYGRQRKAEIVKRENLMRVRDWR